MLDRAELNSPGAARRLHHSPGSTRCLPRRIRAGHVRQGSWNLERVSFLGDAVSLALHDARDGSLYAGLGLGHFGVKLWRSPDLGVTWQEIAAPKFPEQPEGEIDKLPDGKPWPWRVEQIWALERGDGDDLWCGTIGGGLFRSSDHGQSWSLARSLWDHPKRKEWFGGGAEMPGIHSVCVHGGETWQVLTNGLPQNHAYDITYRHGFDIDASGRRLAFGSTTGSLFITENAGDAWTCLSTHLPPIYGVRFAQDS
jgi:hypothetical protein